MDLVWTFSPQISLDELEKMTLPCEVSDTLESCANYWNLTMKVDAQTRRSRNMWSIQHKQESMLDIECCCSRPQSVTEWEWKNWTNKITENLKKKCASWKWQFYTVLLNHLEQLQKWLTKIENEKKYKPCRQQ